MTLPTERRSGSETGLAIPISQSQNVPEFLSDERSMIPVIHISHMALPADDE